MPRYTALDAPKPQAEPPPVLHQRLLGRPQPPAAFSTISPPSIPSPRAHCHPTLDCELAASVAGYPLSRKNEEDRSLIVVHNDGRRRSPRDVQGQRLGLTPIETRCFVSVLGPWQCVASRNFGNDAASVAISPSGHTTHVCHFGQSMSGLAFWLDETWIGFGFSYHMSSQVVAQS